MSIEPLLEDLGNVDYAGMNWVIVGGESGPGARKMQEVWVSTIQRQREEQAISFFFKRTQSTPSGGSYDFDGWLYMKS